MAWILSVENLPEFKCEGIVPDIQTQVVLLHMRFFLTFSQTSSMAYQSLALVKAMKSYLPFDADSASLYEEHVALEQAPPPYETHALRYVLEQVKDPRVKLVVLTGDAGHGKTHLCRRVIELGIGIQTQSSDAAEAALKRLKNDPEGRKAIHLPGMGRNLRVVKDLSEFSESRGAQILSALMSEQDSVAIVCANEGRLRSVVSLMPDTLNSILGALESGIRHGVTGSPDSSVHVVNLNYQATAIPSGGFLTHLLDKWVGDGRRWRSCKECKARSACPILRNRELLVANDRANQSFIQLIRVVEQAGYVLTFREALILCSFAVTGGLTCEDVAKYHAIGAKGVEHLKLHELERLFFERDLSAAEAEQIRVLHPLRRLDPAHSRQRTVDNEIVGQLESELTSGPITTYSAQSTGQFKKSAKELRDHVRRERRRRYFRLPVAASTRERAEALGLNFYAEFEHVQGDDENPKAMLQVIARLVRGLHVIQGIRVTNQSALLLVDPAFTRAGAGTSVIAARIPRNELWLYGLHEFWQEQADAQTDVNLVRSVDWLDRQIVLCRKFGDDVQELLRLDQMQFEYVLRAADGSAFARFHAADRRRILSVLAGVAELNAATSQEIRFISGNNIKMLVIEQDGSIEVHDA